MSAMSLPRMGLSIIPVCLLIACDAAHSQNSFPDYCRTNILANSLTASQIPNLTAVAEGGDAKSAVLLGLAYQNGHGVREDHGAAFRWYKQAAGQGNAMGQDLLGLAYYTGMGTKKDGDEAVTWFQKAAMQGDYTAEYNLAFSLLRGLSSPKNAADARGQVELRANQGDRAARIALGQAYIGAENRLGIHKDYEQGATWLRKASEIGSPIAQADLAALYYAGHGVPQDETEGMKLLLKSAENRYSEALYFLGEIYEHGRGVPKNQLTADMYYVLAEDSCKDVFGQRHGNIFTGGLALFPDHKVTIEDKQRARDLAEQWKADHPAK